MYIKITIIVPTFDKIKILPLCSTTIILSLFFSRSGIKRRPNECSFFNGSTDLFKPDRDMSKSNMTYYNVSKPVTVRSITQCSEVKNDFDGLYLSAVQRGASKGHGIIRINLSQVCWNVIYTSTFLSPPTVTADTQLTTFRSYQLAQ